MDSCSDTTARAAVTDRELMGALCAGDREALGTLMDRHYRRVYRIALSYLREEDSALDAAQETFIKAYQNAHRWNRESEVAPWLTRIAINQSIDLYRRRKRRSAQFQSFTPGDHDERTATAEVSPERRLMGRQSQAQVWSAVASLPERQRSVFVLRHQEEMSLVEIAKVLDMRLGTVKSSLHRAVRQLRAQLGRAGA